MYCLFVYLWLYSCKIILVVYCSRNKLLLLFFTWDLESGYRHVDIFSGHQMFLEFSWLFSGKESILAVMIFIYLQPLFTTWKVYWPAPSWLVSSVGRALHWYCRGHGFKSRSGRIFFRPFFKYQLITARIDSVFVSSTSVHIYDFHTIFRKKRKNGFLSASCIVND